MTHQGWAACLAGFEEHLAAQFELLEQGRPEQLVAFQAPSDLGPLPPGLAARARDVHAQAAALTTAVMHSRNRTAAALAEGRSRAERPRPVLLDSRG